MRKSQCLLFVLKSSYICYYIIGMAVPLVPFFNFVVKFDATYVQLALF